jgi:hypothetical protein
VLGQLQERWVAAQDGAATSAHEEITAFAGLWCRELLADHRDQPGDADNQVGLQAQAFRPKTRLHFLSRWFNK